MEIKNKQFYKRILSTQLKPVAKIIKSEPNFYEKADKYMDFMWKHKFNVFRAYNDDDKWSLHWDNGYILLKFSNSIKYKGNNYKFLSMTSNDFCRFKLMNSEQKAQAIYYDFYEDLDVGSNALFSKSAYSTLKFIFLN